VATAGTREVGDSGPSGPSRGDGVHISPASIAATAGTKEGGDSGPSGPSRGTTTQTVWTSRSPTADFIPANNTRKKGPQYFKDTSDESMTENRDSTFHVSPRDRGEHITETDLCGIFNTPIYELPEGHEGIRSLPLFAFYTTKFYWNNIFNILESLYIRALDFEVSDCEKTRAFIRLCLNFFAGYCEITEKYNRTLEFQDVWPLRALANRDCAALKESLDKMCDAPTLYNFKTMIHAARDSHHSMQAAMMSEAKGTGNIKMSPDLFATALGNRDIENDNLIQVALFARVLKPNRPTARRFGRRTLFKDHPFFPGVIAYMRVQRSAKNAIFNVQRPFIKAEIKYRRQHANRA